MVLGGMIIGSILFMLFFGVLSILALIFWILMLIDCVNRKFKKSDEKIIWIIVIALVGIIGAIIYYFVVKRKAKK